MLNGGHRLEIREIAVKQRCSQNHADEVGESELMHDAGEKDRNEENRLTESEKNRALQKQLEVYHCELKNSL